MLNLKKNMKTPQIIVRQLNGLPIRQNHKTGMFNANDLIDAYNAKNVRKKKFIFNFLRSKATEEYIAYLERKMLRDEDSKYITNDVFENMGVVVDRSKVIKTNRGRVNGGTWMHPNLFIDLAMWLDVEFKDWAITCVGDKLIKLRDQAGDTFKEVNIALGDGRQIMYIEEARMINSLVFGDAKGGQRNNATEEQLELLEKLQRADVRLIKQGLTFEQRKKNLTVFKNLLNA